MKHIFLHARNMRAIVNKIVFFVLSVILIGILALVCWQVVSRYFLNNPSVFTEELVRFLLIWLGALSAVYAFGSNRHVALTLLYDKLAPPVCRVVTIIHHLTILIFSLLFFLWGGGLLMNITSLQVSSVLLIPLNYIYAIFPFCGVMLVGYEVSHIIESLQADTK